MNDFLRRLTILSLIPRRPDWASTAHAARDAAPAPRTGKTSAAQLHAQLHQRGFRGNLRAVQRPVGQVLAPPLFISSCLAAPIYQDFGRRC